jgi:hypothetical protein
MLAVSLKLTKKIALMGVIAFKAEELGLTPEETLKAFKKGEL